MKDRSIADISIKEICALADISRSTFYAHYRDPYDLLYQIGEDIIANYEKIALKYKLNGHDLRQTMVEMLQYVRDNANFVKILFDEHGDIEFQKKFISISNQKTMRRYLSEKKKDQKTDEYRLVFVQAGNIAIIRHWLKTGMKKPIDELAKLIIELNAPIL
jgi:AcrR family transcriptional regulator